MSYFIDSDVIFDVTFTKTYYLNILKWRYKVTTNRLYDFFCYTLESKGIRIFSSYNRTYKLCILRRLDSAHFSEIYKINIKRLKFYSHILMDLARLNKYKKNFKYFLNNENRKL